MARSHDGEDSMRVPAPKSKAATNGTGWRRWRWEGRGRCDFITFEGVVGGREAELRSTSLMACTCRREDLMVTQPSKRRPRQTQGKAKAMGGLSTWFLVV